LLDRPPFAITSGCFWVGRCTKASWRSGLMRRIGLIAGMELFRGTTTQTSVYPREVVRIGLKLNASAVIFAHNHPSGSPEPSRADEMLTNQLRQALSLVDVKVLDHFIVADTTVMSFAEKGLI
jgi:DNA repair protein RadC